MPKIQRRGNYYYVDSDKYVRVSLILDIIAKPSLIPWAARQAAEIVLATPPELRDELTPDRIVNKVFMKRDNAADIGRDVHSILHAFANGAQIDVASLRPEIQGHVQAGLTFFSTLNYKKILFTEIMCYSKTYGYGGTADILIELADNTIWLYDYKTGGVYREVALQLTAYKHALLEMKVIDRIDHTAAVQLKDNGEFVVKTSNEPIEPFLQAKGLFEWSISSSFY